MNKTTIRSILLKQRKSLNQQQINYLSEQVVKHIAQSGLYQQSQHVALYLPCNGEVDLTALLKVKNKHHYLPSIHDKRMQFQHHTPTLALEKHRYGIIQPNFIESLEPVELDLCLMPLIGFDLDGNRLGMGGGFYDRYFEHNNNAQLAGIGYQFQQREKLPTQSWDVRINHLFTEQGYLKL
jgi:5-formyltetrahydrofolate cyclo-ligase